MSFFDNIERIERRMQQIEQKFNSEQAEIDPEQSFSSILNQLTSPQRFVSPGEMPWGSPNSGATAPVPSIPVAPISEKGEVRGSFAELINAAGEKYGVDPKLVAAIIHQESGGNPNAVSHAGALGLMQLMPETANSLGVLNPYDPRENIFGGVRYFKGLLERFQGNMSLALAAYNAGPNAVAGYGGIPPYRETQNYVESILALYKRNRESSP